MKNILFDDENVEEVEVDSFIEELKQVDKKVEKVLVKASLGLWYGRKEGKGAFDSLSEAVSICSEDHNVFFTARKNGVLQLEAVHHDGTNYFKFYKLVNGKITAITTKDLYGV